MKKILILFALLFAVETEAQNFNLFNVENIPDSLLKNADAVKRMELLEVVIQSPSEAIIRQKYAITILNEAGSKYAQYVSFYNKMTNLKEASGSLYDAEGKLIKTVKKKDMIDRAYDDRMSLITDDRLKLHNFLHKTYPYTVLYEEENIKKGIFFLTNWNPFGYYDIAVQESKLIVTCPADYALRYKEINYAGKPKIEPTEKTKTYTWSLNDAKAIVSEPFQPSFAEVATSVLLAPSEFEIAGYKGNMENWASLGKFINVLNNGRDILPENLKKEVHTLTDNLPSAEAKIEALYNYLQKNTRYISIQLGIGGWQPLEASFVADKKYGDCKALSNFMQSLLKEAGIKSNYVLITAGKGEQGLKEDFAAPFFNHAVLCVPNGKDTIWLECTNQISSFGYMGSSTGNRKALLITETGAKPVSTPRYTEKENQELRWVKASIDTLGNLSAAINTLYKAEKQEQPHGLMYRATQEEKDKYLNSKLDLSTYKVSNIQYKEKRGRLPEIEEQLSLEVAGYASVSGKRMFLVPNLLNKVSKLALDKDRKTSIVFKSAFTEIDSIKIQIPVGYTAETVPPPLQLSNQFGSYQISYQVEENTILFVRKQVQPLGTFPPNEYEALVKYFAAMYKADNARIVLVKKG